MKTEIEWHEIKYREPTEEEKAEFERMYGINCCFWYDCKLPDDGEEVLIATKYGTSIATFCCDEGCYFEEYDYDEVLAWLELPKYEKRGEQ